MNREHQQDSAAFTVRRLMAEDLPGLYDLRARVLRAGLPPETAHFTGDELPTTIHLGAFATNGRLVSIGTLMENKGLQLRGMATEPEVRGQGAGAALLREIQRIGAAMEKPLWCNARTSAVPFYAKMGWKTEGDEFEIAEAGPHYVMRFPSAG